VFHPSEATHKVVALIGVGAPANRCFCISRERRHAAIQGCVAAAMPPSMPRYSAAAQLRRDVISNLNISHISLSSGKSSPLSVCERVSLLWPAGTSGDPSR